MLVYQRVPQIWVSHIFPSEVGNQWTHLPRQTLGEAKQSTFDHPPEASEPWMVSEKKGEQRFDLDSTWKNVNGHCPKRKIIFRSTSSWGAY
jgi:hypothetical protein